MAAADSVVLIVEAMQRLLRRNTPREVLFAQPGPPPPPLSYVTSFPRLSIVLGGRQQVTLVQEGCVEQRQLRPGQSLFVPANCWNLPDWSKPVQLCTILLGVRQIGISLVETTGGEPTSATKATVSRHEWDLCSGPLTGLIALARRTDRAPLDSLLVRSLLHGCIMELQQARAVPSTKGTRMYGAVCLYIQEKFHTPLTRDSIAEAFGVHPNHISRLFHQNGQVTVSDYINFARLARAKFLLRNYDMPLKQIAFRCGYAEVGYFCRVFKQMTKVTPTQYRQSNSLDRDMPPAQRAGDVSPPN